MADINNKALLDLEKMLNTAWQAGLDQPRAGELLALATEFASSGAANYYAFLQKLPQWREYSGERVFKDVESETYSLKNRKFESSITIGLDEIEDEQAGMYASIVPQMVEGWFNQLVSLVIEVLTSNPTAFDGVALFSAAGRTYGDNTISNYTTSALAEATFETAMIAMQSYKLWNDAPALVRPNVLVVGPKLEKTAWDIVGNYYASDGETSAVAVENFFTTKRVTPVVSPWLVGTYDDYWYLADTTKAIKPLALQIRKSPTPVLSGIESMERTQQVDYMATGRAAAGPALPHLIYGGIVA
jgi:phage major head subunit gpT-like protein